MKSTEDTEDAPADGDTWIGDANDTKQFANNDTDEFRKEIQRAGSDGTVCSAGWAMLFGGCILVSALFNLLLPVCIENNQYTLTCIIRTCQGLAEGFLIPSLYGVLRHWTVPSERSIQVTAVLSCEYDVGPGHEMRLDDVEFEFMTHAQGDDVNDYEKVNIPLKSILTSLPVAAMCLCQIAILWIRTLLLTNWPLYLSTVWGNIAEVGALASLPYASNIVMSVVSGILADFFLNQKYLTTTIVRKISIGVGFGLVCVGFLVLTTLSASLAVFIVLSMSIGAFGLAGSGLSVNPYNLSTRYASVLAAVTWTCGSIGAILAPIATGYLTVKQRKKYN
ncbi:probable vesicular glutamate transporter eat-4 [Dreissena polymorpha]|uniref:probable vesicular glutamate transporter eat-4 n=1 Tax=Dreissena polymorpha TaxID=45954 RepID=UPI00226448AE|nr:probable vesicular glutamate transporter eat-4 [Dreissena polymorpha]